MVSHPLKDGGIGVWLCGGVLRGGARGAEGQGKGCGTGVWLCRETGGVWDGARVWLCMGGAYGCVACDGRTASILGIADRPTSDLFDS